MVLKAKEEMKEKQKTAAQQQETQDVQKQVISCNFLFTVENPFISIFIYTYMASSYAAYLL